MAKKPTWGYGLRQAWARNPIKSGIVAIALALGPCAGWKANNVYTDTSKSLSRIMEPDLRIEDNYTLYGKSYGPALVAEDEDDPIALIGLSNERKIVSITPVTIDRGNKRLNLGEQKIMLERSLYDSLEATIRKLREEKAKKGEKNGML